MGCGASNNKLQAVQEPQPIINKITPKPKEKEQLKKNKHSQDVVVQDLDGEVDFRTEVKGSPNKSKNGIYNIDEINPTINTLKTPGEQILQLKRYQKGQLIDKGAYGKVYKGIDTVTNEVVAIKYIEISGTLEVVKKEITSLKKEISLLKKLNHPNIVKYFDFDVSDDKSGVDIILEYVPNGSIRMTLNRQKCFDETKTALYTKQVLEGLEYLHKNNIIHRDLKGANLLLDGEGRAKLTDFGTAKQIASDLQKSQLEGEEDIAKLNKSLKGTPNWMAPEVIERVGHTSSADIWSIGCIVIEMLTGKPPYPNMPAKEVFIKIVSGALPEFPKGISYECQEFLEACLQTDPKKRLTATQLLKTPFILRKKIRRPQSQNSLVSQEELLEQINILQQGQNIQQEYQYNKKGSLRSIKGSSSTQIKTPLIISNQKDQQNMPSQPILLSKPIYQPDSEYVKNQQKYQEYTQKNQQKYLEHQDKEIDQMKERTKSLNHFSNNSKLNSQNSFSQIQNKIGSKTQINAEEDILQLAKGMRRQQDFVQVNVNPGYQQYTYLPNNENVIKYVQKEYEPNHQEQIQTDQRNKQRQNSFSQQKQPTQQKSKPSLADIKDEEELDTTEVVRKSQKLLTLLKAKYKNLNEPQTQSSQPILGQDNGQRERFLSYGYNQSQNSQKKNGKSSFEDIDIELPQDSRDVPYSRSMKDTRSFTQINKQYYDKNDNKEEEYTETETVNNTQTDQKENAYYKHEDKVISTKSATMQRMMHNRQLANQSQYQPQNQYYDHSNQVINTDIAKRERSIVLQEKQEFQYDKVKRQQAWEEELQRELEYQRQNPPPYLKY